MHAPSHIQLDLYYMWSWKVLEYTASGKVTEEVNQFVVKEAIIHA